MAHYTSELLAALAAAFPQDEWRSFVPGREPLPSATGAGGATGGHSAGGATEGHIAGGAGRASRATIVRHPLPSRHLFGTAALTGRPRLDRLAGGADVAWIPAPAPVAVSREVPYVLTVHDLSWVERPGDFTPYERAWHRLGRLERLAERARVVVAVSEATREAIRARWPKVRDVRVVRSGIPALPPPGARPAWLPQRYVLAVGALEPRKAPDALRRAFADARRRGLDADLVFAGGGRLADAVAGDGVHVVASPDRATLAALYEHALALALPSHLEGFGFTALEAARAGVPVLANDLPVLRETLGDAFLRVDDWPAALLTIAGDDTLRSDLAAAGRRAAGRFDWATTAAEMHAVLAEAATR